MKTAYIPKKRFTQRQFEKAASIDVLAFLQQRGHEFKRYGSTYRMKEHDSFVIDRKNNLWHWFSRGIGGGAIGFLTKVENMDIVDAVLLLCGEEHNEERMPAGKPKEAEQPKPKMLIVPPASGNTRHTFAYLSKSRLIDKGIISVLMNQGKIYESAEHFAKVQIGGQVTSAKLVNDADFSKLQGCGLVERCTEKDGLKLGYNYEGKLKYVGLPELNHACIFPHRKSGILQSVSVVNNCVFCGYDEHGEMKYAAMRSVGQNSHFRMDAVGSDKQYGFCMEGKSDSVYVFEAAIDAMSHATLFQYEGFDWKQDSRISLSGVSELALDQFLKTHPAVKKIHFCLDNDEVGRNNVYGVYDKAKGEYTTRSLLKKYQDKGYEVSADFPVLKDYNEDLESYCRERSEGEEIEL